MSMNGLTNEEIDIALKRAEEAKKRYEESQRASKEDPGAQSRQGSYSAPEPIQSTASQDVAPPPAAPPPPAGAATALKQDFAKGAELGARSLAAGARAVGEGFRKGVGYMSPESNERGLRTGAAIVNPSPIAIAQAARSFSNQQAAPAASAESLPQGSAAPVSAAGSPAAAGASPFEELPVVPRGTGAGGGGGGGYSEKVTAEEGHRSPEAEGNYNMAAAAGMQGLRQQRDANRDYFQGTFAAERVKQDAIDAANAQHAQIAALRAADSRALLSRIDTLNNEASAKVGGEEQYWAEKGPLARIIGAIAMGLGAFGAAHTGGVNQAAAIIENQVNRAVNTQLDRKALAQRGLQNTQDLLGLHMKALGDQDLAIEATKKGMLEKSLAMLDQEAAQRGLTLADANYNQTRGQLLERIAATQLHMQTLADGKVVREYQEKGKFGGGAMPGGGGGGGVAGEGGVVGAHGKKGGEEGYIVVEAPAADNLPSGQSVPRVHVAIPKEGAAEAIGANNRLNDAKEKLRDIIKKRAEMNKYIDAGEYGKARTMAGTIDSEWLSYSKGIEKGTGQGVYREVDQVMESLHGLNPLGDIYQLPDFGKGGSVLGQLADMALPKNIPIRKKLAADIDYQLQDKLNQISAAQHSVLKGNEVLRPVADEQGRRYYQHTGLEYKGADAPPVPRGPQQ